ncbi:hypothetical protein MHYP_G00330580 [Metynnis hypsauchen]
MEREVDRRIGAASAVMRTLYRSVMVKRAEPEGEAVNLSVNLRSPGSPLERVRSSAIRERLGVEPLLLHVESSQLRWFGHLVRMASGRLPREVFQTCPTGRRPWGRPRTRWRDYIARLSW